jgi:hypothetical protein
MLRNRNSAYGASKFPVAAATADASEMSDSASANSPCHAVATARDVRCTGSWPSASTRLRISTCLRAIAVDVWKSQTALLAAAAAEPQ